MALASALAVCGAFQGAQAKSYNAVDEFALKQGGNTGVWKYGYTADSKSNALILYPDTRTVDNCDPGTTYQDWLNAALGDPPGLGHNSTGADYNCNGIRFPANAFHLHPGANGQRSVLRWTAPSAGTLAVSGAFEGLNSTTTDVRIVKNAGTASEKTIFTGDINGFGNQQPFELAGSVASGDTIDFSVGYGTGGYSYDSTGLAVTVVSKSRNANLSNLTLSAGTLAPTFASGTTSYKAAVPNTTTSVTVTPKAAQAKATITVNGARVVSGSTSAPISLAAGDNTITIVVTAEDGTTTKTYTVIVTAGASEGGSLKPDLNFRVPRFVEPSPGSYIRPVGGGKYLHFGFADSVLGKPTIGAIGRYFADGTLDTSFQVSRDYYEIIAAAPLPNGQVIVAATRTSYGVVYVQELLRLNLDGSIDPSFEAVVGDSYSGIVRGLTILDDGRILASGYFTSFGGEARPGIVRLLPNGDIDNSFAAVPFSWYGGTGYLQTGPHEVAVQPDGKLIVFGYFDHIGSTALPGLARLNANGTLDDSFQPSGFGAGPGQVRAAVLQGDGKIIVGGSGLRVAATFASNRTGTEARLPLVRLNANGTTDESYGYFGEPTRFFSVRDIILQPDGKVLIVDSYAATVSRYNSNGALDSGFHQPAFRMAKLPNYTGFPYDIARLGDGRLLVSGSFTDVDTASPNESNFGVVRLAANGTVDRTLKTKQKMGYTTYADSVARVASGATYIAISGFGATGDTTVPNNFARLNPKGVIDGTFNPFIYAAADAPLPPSFVASGFKSLNAGKFFIYGTREAYGEFAYGRLLADGTQEAGFITDPAVPPLFNGGYRYTRAFPLPNDAVLLGADDAQAIVNGGTLIRLTPGGALDESFKLPAAIRSRLVVRDPSGQITNIRENARALAVQPDGKILFVYYHTNTTCRLVRLNPNGTLDGTFSPVTVVPVDVHASYSYVYDPQTGGYVQPPNGGVAGEALATAHLQDDGRIVIAGPFKSINGTAARGIARLNPNGSIDTSFKRAKGPGWTSMTETAKVRPIVEQVESQPGGKLLITGTFETFNGVAAPGIASLDSDGSLDTSFVPPAIRQPEYYGRSVLERQPDDSFLLSGPYSFPGETLAPLLMRLANQR